MKHVFIAVIDFPSWERPRLFVFDTHKQALEYANTARANGYDACLDDGVVCQCGGTIRLIGDSAGWFSGKCKHCGRFVCTK